MYIQEIEWDPSFPFPQTGEEILPLVNGNDHSELLGLHCGMHACMDDVYQLINAFRLITILGWPFAE